MTGIVSGIGVRAALGAAGARLRQISPRTWLIIGCAVAAILGALWARHWYHEQIKAAEKRGSDAAYASIEKQANDLKAKADALSVSIATKLREKNDEENRANARAADALRLSGPGKARCGNPGLSAPSGGSEQADRNADAAVAQMSDETGAELIAMPFDDAISFGEQHDTLRSEVLSWRSWYSAFDAQWKKWQADSKPAR